MKFLNRITPNHIFLLITCVYMAGFFAHALYLQKTVYGDGVYYYDWLRSSIIDHQIDFPLGNKYTIGPAILWAPAFTAVHQIVRGDGYILPYQLAVGFMSVSLALVGLLLLWRLLAKWFGKTVSIMATAAVAGATNLLFYGSIDAVNSHALSLFAAVFFLSLLFAKKQKQWLAIGVSLGLLGLIRTQDLVYGLILVPFLTKKNVFAVLCGFGLTFLLQLVAWQTLYGNFWVSPYLTGNEGFNLWNPHILGVFFNPQNGLYLWTPMALLGTIGLFTGRKDRIPYRVYMIAVLFLELYIISTWTTWWQGASYSGRMLVSSLPVLGFGIASLFSWLAKYKWTTAYFLLTVVGPLTVINALLIITFLLNQ